MTKYAVNLDVLATIIVEAESVKQAEEKAFNLVPGLEREEGVEDIEIHRWEFFDTAPLEGEIIKNRNQRRSHEKGLDLA